MLYLENRIFNITIKFTNAAIMPFCIQVTCIYVSRFTRLNLSVVLK